jgi:hypothetical protein
VVVGLARRCLTSLQATAGAGIRAAEYQISGKKNQPLTGHPGDFRFQRHTKIKLASQISQW